MKPEISAVLTTHNHAHFLPMVLEGLARQNLQPSRFEVVVVDDGSTDDTQKILKEWQTRLPMRIVRQNRAGLAAAKNLGIFVASGPVIVFLDDDNVADPDLLVMHLASHLAFPDSNVAVLGYTSIAEDIRQIPVMRHVTEVGCQLFSHVPVKPGEALDYTAFLSGRSSCKRSLLVQKGIFNPDFDSGCEDIELGWRLARHGLRVIYQPQARSVMIKALTFDQFCERSYRQGRSQYRFSQLHKETEIQTYCEIMPALQGWREHSQSYEAHLQWTQKLDRLAVAWKHAGISVPAIFQRILDDAYRQAFFLSRAKAIADARRLDADKNGTQATWLSKLKFRFL
ncbi:MAG: glycosyltransferase family 2 protein [Rhodospirillales bacterium]|nr:glycosyltransferase family 2 protein [Rhodospirillales bacterium]